MTRTRQLKLGLDPGPAHNIVPVAEADVYSAVDEGCAWLHWDCLSTVVRLRWPVCMHCGRKTKPDYRTGMSRGVPDRLIAAPGYPKGVWLGVELKGARTRLSAEQRDLRDRGRIVVARDWDDVLRAVEDARETWEGRG